MNETFDSHSEINSRRGFLKQISAGAAGLAIGSLFGSGEAFSKNASFENSRVSFVTGSDQRETAYQTLKPLEKEIKNAIKDKQIVIKVNMGQIRKDWWLNASDVNQVRGILDFLKPIYKKKVIVAESTAAGAKSTLEGFENYNYMPILREYNVRFADLNDESTTTMWVQGENRHPLALNIIDTFLDPDVYLISATRLKTHNCVIATLSLKNIVMGAPINHYKQKKVEGSNEKPRMHEGGNRGLSYNMFLLANMGIRPDLAVLDGVVGMEGDGPVRGTPAEQGVALASTDWLAADRLGVELMGMDYDEVKYLHWCASAGMGQDDLSKIIITGTDYTKHIMNYKLHKNIERQREWVREDFEKKA